MRIVVPYDATRPKTRLSGLFDADERAALARTMLDDVLGSLAEAECEPTLVATEPVDVPVSVEVDDRPLTAAVNAVLDGSDGPVAVVMADLPLLTPDGVSRLFSPVSDLVVAPGRAGGTNALVAYHPDFRVDYHGTSYLDHLDAAAALGATVETVDSHRLATDVDERDDLVEVLVHGQGTATRAWLVERGVELVVGEGRVGVDRR